jgi:hypothetical protein
VDGGRPGREVLVRDAEHPRRPQVVERDPPRPEHAPPRPEPSRLDLHEEPPRARHDGQLRGLCAFLGVGERFHFQNYGSLTLAQIKRLATAGKLPSG